MAHGTSKTSSSSKRRSSPSQSQSQSPNASGSGSRRTQTQSGSGTQGPGLVYDPDQNVNDVRNLRSGYRELLSQQVGESFRSLFHSSDLIHDRDRGGGGALDLRCFDSTRVSLLCLLLTAFLLFLTTPRTLRPMRLIASDLNGDEQTRGQTWPT